MTAPASSHFQVPACSGEEKLRLIQLAHEAILNGIQGRPPPEPAADSLSPGLHAPGATFVTLHHAGRLRGCVGNLVARDPLYRSVMTNATGAALRDNRFGPVTVGEQAAITVHISILSALFPLRFNTVRELLEQITPRLDGVVLRQGGRMATYLPQVWESMDDRETFLNSLALKAGLAEPAWREPDAEILLYRVSQFGEAA